MDARSTTRRSNKFADGDEACCVKAKIRPTVIASSGSPHDDLQVDEIAGGADAV